MPSTSYKECVIPDTKIVARRIHQITVSSLMRILFQLIVSPLFLSILGTIHAQGLDPLLLWPGGAPGALGTEPKDTPTVTPYLPAKETATGAAIVICPGGGYGHLASTLQTHFDSGMPDSPDRIERESSRPDLGILCYAVITMGEFTHQGSKRNLLGANPSPELIELLSDERQVTADTPPTFVWHTFEDTAVPVENSLQFTR